MIKYSCSPAPRGVNLRPLSSFLTLSIALLCLTAVGVSAQTRAKRADGGPEEERARRVRAVEGDGDKLDEAKTVPQNPQVRKTALSYSNASQPALTNDIVIISRAPAAAASRVPVAPKAGAASASIPSIWPVVGSLRSGVGTRKNPFGGSSYEFHKGQDISAPMGTPINATADGVVVIARRLRGYGNGIYIDHGNGIETRYGHLSRIDVIEGQPVKKGQHLGLVGSTGRSTGPHLHYEVRINGQPTSPLLYLPDPAPVPPPPPVALPAAKGN
ncbi:MAG TPA: M23 family metallopeptidase [Pyrinomonadaceae bacterium]|nr:M23 family metallopeptidase [Pyrinomonadaceae bacterium]